MGLRLSHDTIYHAQNKDPFRTCNYAELYCVVEIEGVKHCVKYEEVELWSNDDEYALQKEAQEEQADEEQAEEEPAAKK